ADPKRVAHVIPLGGSRRTLTGPPSGPAAPALTEPRGARPSLLPGDQRQPQAPPQQPPPPPAGIGARPPPRPPTATVGSSLTVSACPAGHCAGSFEALIGRETSKVS